MYKLRYDFFQKLLSIFGILLNAELLYLMFTRSPNTMRPCKIVIIVKSAIDFFGALLNLFVIERLLSTSQNVLIISEGLCGTPLRCFSAHMLLMSLLQQNLVWQVAAYIFRYYVLRFRDPSTKCILTVFSATYAPSLVHSLVWISAFSETVADQFPPKIFSKPEDTVMAAWAVHQSTLAVLAQLTVTSLVVFAFYLWIRHNMVNFLEENTARMSKNSMVLNTQLLKTAHSQAIIPLCILLGISFFFSMHLNTINPILVQCVPSLLFILPSIISPVGYILFLPPYWNFCFGIPRRSKSRKIKSILRINTVESSNTVSISNPVVMF